MVHIDGLVQDCSISSALAMEILQSCTKPSWPTDQGNTTREPHQYDMSFYGNTIIPILKIR